MNLTILMYSLFTFVSAFSQQWWHLAIFRFLVAMGALNERVLYLASGQIWTFDLRRSRWRRRTEWAGRCERS